MSNLIENITGNNSMIKNYSKLLDLSSLKNKVTAANIANVETPNYERQTFDFDSELKKSMEEPRIKPVETHPRHIPLSNSNANPPNIKSIKSSVNSTGVNSVDIDREMAELAQNQITYQYGSKMLSKKFNGLRDAIKGR